jgi:hypothetical protein
VRTGTDRYAPGYEGGTRHPCPFCDWYLDAEPLPPKAAGARGWEFMDSTSRRLEEITVWVEKHLQSDHPIEYELAQRVDRIG